MKDHIDAIRTYVLASHTAATFELLWPLGVNDQDLGLRPPVPIWSRGSATVRKSHVPAVTVLSYRPATRLGGKSTARDLVKNSIYATWQGVCKSFHGYVENVGKETTPTTAERVSKIGEKAGWQGEIVVVLEDRLPAHLKMKANLSQDLVIDSTRIRVELGYQEPVSLDEALERAIAWERANPP